MDIREILNQRAQTHGHYPLHAYITQRMKELFRQQENWSRLTDAQREFLDMDAHKVGRILAGDPTHTDHYKDISGYAELCVQELEQNAPVPTAAPTSRRNYSKGADYKSIADRLVELNTPATQAAE